MPLFVELDDDRRGFSPGQTIGGGARWEDLPDGTEAVELRLYYFTEGRGTKDTKVAERLRFDAASSGAQRFDIETPAGPYSCAGALVSVLWALELVALPGEAHSEPVELSVSPSGAAVELAALAPFEEDDEGDTTFGFRFGK